MALLCRVSDLPRRFRQLMCLVDDNGEAVRQDGLAVCATVDGIRQQKVGKTDFLRILGIFKTYATGDGYPLMAILST